jgi:hypothetical protein
LALGKVLLATGLLLFTFVAMLGGNPLHEYVLAVAARLVWMLILSIAGSAFVTGKTPASGLATTPRRVCSHL